EGRVAIGSLDRPDLDPRVLTHGHQHVAPGGPAAERHQDAVTRDDLHPLGDEVRVVRTIEHAGRLDRHVGVNAQPVEGVFAKRSDGSTFVAVEGTGIGFTLAERKLIVKSSFWTVPVCGSVPFRCTSMRSSWLPERPR